MHFPLPHQCDAGPFRKGCGGAGDPKILEAPGSGISVRIRGTNSIQGGKLSLYMLLMVFHFQENHNKFKQFSILKA